MLTQFNGAYKQHWGGGGGGGGGGGDELESWYLGVDQPGFLIISQQCN